MNNDQHQDLDRQLLLLGLKRSCKFAGIGKLIGGDLYCHRQYESQLPASELAHAKKALPEGYDYQVVKYSPAAKSFSFIKSRDFDTAHEPGVHGGVTVRPDGSCKRFNDNGWIYHHKWMWVADDYTGFDVRASKLRSLRWYTLLGVDRSRIGQRKFWEREVVPRIDTGDAGQASAPRQEHAIYEHHQQNAPDKLRPDPREQPHGHLPQR